MNFYYTAEKNVQMLVSLLKAHGIKKIIASPGTTNITFVASLQHDSFFQIYSAADERSAAYMACGLAIQSGEPVVLTCTGATASRNYVAGLTEAYYRKIPVLAVTSTQHLGRVGQLNPQVIDRSIIQKDIAVLSVQIPQIYCEEDEWDCNVKLNNALLALTRNGGGPVHINLVTNYSDDFTVKELPDYRVIHRIKLNDCFPKINVNKVGIFVGAHNVWSKELTSAVDKFCEVYNGVVICDHTSNYHGKYRIQFNLIAGQTQHYFDVRKMDLLIDMGEMSGAYMGLNPKEVWRVNIDGEVRDTWKAITNIFDMEEIDFFAHYIDEGNENKKNIDYYLECKNIYDNIYNQISDFPFSNIWIAQKTINLLPDNSVLHLGILNTLRSWNFFEAPPSIACYCNTGGFGIDGIVSTFIGASLAKPDCLFFCVVGDLAFFYDLNAIANHNVGNNIRILLINNGCGTEFKNYSHFAAQFGEEANEYMSAMGHYGKKSKDLIRHYSKDLGFEYMAASDKEEFKNKITRFVTPHITDKPMLFEVFTDYKDESDALNLINHIVEDAPTPTDIAKKTAKNVLGEKNLKRIKRFIKR